MSGVIQVTGLGKSYRQWGSEWRRFSSWFVPGMTPRGENWVLRDVSFTVAAGETIGIIGQNGAGKSTLLKLIVGTTQPTRGHVGLHGRVGAILELGMGFNPELTGRQNAYHSAGLMGHSFTEIQRVMPEIESFAEVGGYFDQPVRIYSSGMQMRVAFSVATAFRPEVLIIDEALSVGDSYFQHKSFARIRHLKEHGASILLVTHAMGDVRALCDRAILLEHGQVIKDAPADEVIDYYNALTAEHENRRLDIEQSRKSRGWSVTEYGTREAYVESIKLVDVPSGKEIEIANVGQEMIIRTTVKVVVDLPRIVLGHRITDRTGHVVWGTNTWHTRQPAENVKAGSTITFSAQFKCTLGPGSYALSFGLVSSDTHLDHCYHKKDNPLVFDVINADKPVFIGTSWLNPEFDIRINQPGKRSPLRIAIISSPRSGNTWLRLMLADIYAAQEIAVHSPLDIDWNHLPDGNLVLQLHWQREPEILQQLRTHGFKVVVLHRHPLDVLLSILHFAPKEPQTACWLNGEAGDEACIRGCTPTSDEFLKYAIGPRARALLGVSREWSCDPEVNVVSYEDLVHDTDLNMRKLASTLGEAAGDIQHAVVKCTFEALRANSANCHFWQGRPGLWRELLPAEVAGAIKDAQHAAFDCFGYPCDPDMMLGNSEAEQRWKNLRR